VGTALVYVLVLLGVAAVFFTGAAVLFGRGEELAPIPRGISPTWLPEQDVTARDVRAVRFQLTVRGYRMAEVDWVLDRLADELDRLAGEHARLCRRIIELELADEPAINDPGDLTGDPTEDVTEEPAQKQEGSDAHDHGS